MTATARDWAELLRGPRSYSVQAPTERQAVFLASTAREALFGGAAGGGKSSALLMAALQHVHTPGYAALILRRTYADLALPGAIMDRSHDWLGGTDASWNGTDKRWTFPSGATLSFGYLDTDRDRFRYQGAELQYCVAAGTPVLMADGTWRSIERVLVGDMVATLEGPRAVTRTHRPGMRPVSLVETAYGSTVVGSAHALMTPCGSWVSPMELLATRCLPFGSTCAVSSPIHRAECMPCGSRPLDPQQVGAHGLQSALETRTQGFGASSEDGQTCCEAFGSERQECAPQQQWDGRLAVLERALPLSEVECCAACGDPLFASLQGSTIGYPTCRHCGGGHVRPPSTGAQGGIQQRDDVGTCARSSMHAGGQGNTQAHIHQTYAHPYTREPRPCVERVHHVSACISQAGEAEVFDLTVACASHYIVYPGLIARNCGFDEATQFPESWYRYLLSRLRRREGVNVPLRARLATNPGGIGHEWVKRRFIDSDDPERAFVPSLLSDNPHLDQAAYRAQLELLDLHTKRQLLHGEWVNDPGGLVYPFDEARTLADQAPPLTQYVLGIDFGVVDATAFTVLGWAAHDPTVWIVESYGRSGMSPSDAADEVRALMERYRFERIVGDVGGLGKAFAEEMRSRHSLPIEAAEKHNKRGYQSLMVGDLERGRIRVIRATCTQLIDEWRELPWTADRSRQAEGFEDHAADSALYGWRAAHAFLETPKATAPKPGSREAELAAFEERRRKATEERERDFWQRASGEGEWWRR